MAWLSSVPKRGDKDKNEKRRADLLPDKHPAKNLPVADRYICSCFDLLGHCTIGDMGSIRNLSWTEIVNFSVASTHELTGWENEQLMSMSVAYCNMHSKAKKHSCKAPYQKALVGYDAIQALHNSVDAQLDAFFK